MTAVVLLIDDIRRFRDNRPCLLARTPDEGLDLVRAHRLQGIDELWLDHDLGWTPDGQRRTVMPVVAELVRAAATSEPYRIGRILIHSANPAGALAIRRALESAGYAVVRHHALIWRHEF